MIHLDLILSIPDAEIQLVPQADHKAIPIKHVMKKPKLSLWELYKIKKMLEDGYDRLIKEPKIDDVSSIITSIGKYVSPSISIGISLKIISSAYGSNTL